MAGTESQTIEELRSLDCFLWLAQLAFYIAQAHLSREGIMPSDWDEYSLRKCLAHVTTSCSDLSGYSAEVFFFPVDSRFMLTFEANCHTLAWS